MRGRKTGETFHSVVDKKNFTFRAPGGTHSEDRNEMSEIRHGRLWWSPKEAAGRRRNRRNSALTWNRHNRVVLINCSGIASGNAFSFCPREPPDRPFCHFSKSSIGRGVRRQAESQLINFKKRFITVTKLIPFIGSVIPIFRFRRFDVSCRCRSPATGRARRKSIAAER